MPGTPNPLNPDRNAHERKSKLLRDFLDGATRFQRGDFPDEVYIVVAGFWYTDWPSNDPDEHYYVRLYVSLDLNEYIEFEFGAIRYIANYEESVDPPTVDKLLTPVIVWLARNARIRHAWRSEDESITRQEDFLAGDIVDLYLSPSAQELPARTGGGRRMLARSLYEPCSWGGCGSEKPPCVGGPTG
jgi:hypothetical protein